MEIQKFNTTLEYEFIIEIFNRIIGVRKISNSSGFARNTWSVHIIFVLYLHRRY